MTNILNGSSPKIMRTPRSIDLEITSRCNARCLYCYYFNNPDVDYHDLSTQEWLTFFDELGTLGVMDVTIAGGEPFTRRDLPELLSGLVRNRMRYSILSNGKLITEEMAGFIAGTHRCDTVQISVDGSNAEIHDMARGQGSFEGAVSGIRTLQRHGVNVSVRVTIHHFNVHELDQIAHFLLEELGLGGFSTNSAGYLGSCQRNSGMLLLDTAERQEAMESLLRLETQYPGRIAATAGPLADGHMWTEMENAYQRSEEPFPNGGRLTGCGCPSTRIAIRSDGSFVPCTLLPHMILGQINQDSLSEIWRKSDVLNQFRGRSNIPLTSFESCQGCNFSSYCTGNCPALAYSLTGDVNVPSPDACLRRYLAEGGVIPHLHHK